jgi:hypothetical protein
MLSSNERATAGAGLRGGRLLPTDVEERLGVLLAGGVDAASVGRNGIGLLLCHALLGLNLACVGVCRKKVVS